MSKSKKQRWKPSEMQERVYKLLREVGISKSKALRIVRDRVSPSGYISLGKKSKSA